MLQNAQVVNIKGGPVGDQVQFTIGDQVIPVTKATIEMAAGEYVSITMSVKAGHIDLQALADKSHIVVIDENEDTGEVVTETTNPSGVLNKKVTQTKEPAVAVS